MKLTIQDFGLYLGAPCECKSPSRQAMGHIDSVFLHGRTIASAGYGWMIRDVKPILRTLSSLTESEAQELYEVVYGRKWDPLVGSVVQPCLELWWHSADDGLCYPLADLIGDPKGWRWLLAHHFDLFGWIEAGLALDAAKQKTV